MTKRDRQTDRQRKREGQRDGRDINKNNIISNRYLFASWSWFSNWTLCSRTRHLRAFSTRHISPMCVTTLVSATIASCSPLCCNKSWYTQSMSQDDFIVHAHHHPNSVSPLFHLIPSQVQCYIKPKSGASKWSINKKNKCYMAHIQYTITRLLWSPLPHMLHNSNSVGNFMPPWLWMKSRAFKTTMISISVLRKSVQTSQCRSTFQVVFLFTNLSVR